MATFQQRLQRLSLRIQELLFWRERVAQDLDGWTFDGEPIELGAPWPRADGVVQLENPSASVPDSWALGETRLELAFGGEGLLRIDYGGGVSEVFGVDPWHRRFPLRAQTFSLRAELVARLPFGRPNPAPRLEVARLTWIDPAVDSLCRRLRLAADAAAALAGSDAAEALVCATEGALAEVELPSGSGEYLGRMARAPILQTLWSRPVAPPPMPLPEHSRTTVLRAMAVLEEEMGRIRAAHPPRGRLALAGHAHLDLAWLWPLDETARKAQRTFANACHLLERYPEATFTQSSAELYQLVKDCDPDLFQRVRGLVAGGRWEPTGGMWVEADLNLTSGESLVRQLLHGQRWFRNEFGITHSVGWLPDCFGFSPALPQLLRGAGIDSLFTAKLTWSETNPFPYDLWWWEGLDGSRVLAHSFRNREGRPEGLGSYNGDPSPDVLLAIWDAFQGRAHHPESLFTIGYGDGGGGLNEEMLEDVRALRGFPALPELSFTRIDDFFRRLHQTAARCEVPVWVGEMYLELHRGTYTTQGRIKWLHRRAERDLVAAEAVHGLARLLEVDGPCDLARAWRLLLRNQFHDILPGSGIREVVEQAERELVEVVTAARTSIDTTLGRLTADLCGGDGAGLLVVNPDLCPRPLRAVVAQPVPGAQRVEEGWVVSGPPVGGLEVAVLPGVTAPTGNDAARARGRVLENGLVRVELAEDGTLASVVDIRLGREVLDGRGNQLWVRPDRPRAWEAWDIDEDVRTRGERLGTPDSVEVVEEGPHRAAIRLRWRWRSSHLTQVVRLWSGSPRIEFATHLEWHERRWLLEATFPLAVRSPAARFETAFGVVERPTHRNTSWDQARFEVPAHRFADLSEPGFGVALLNDGRYGHHALGGELGISLLRSPMYPDPLADEGEHRFTYALLPHPGPWLEGGVLAEAEDLNRPLLVRPCRVATSRRWRPLAVGGLTVALAALKPAEEAQGLVLRLYEPQGARGTVELAVPTGWRLAAELDLLECPIGPPDLRFRPFQVRSYLLEPAGAGPGG